MSEYKIAGRVHLYRDGKKTITLSHPLKNPLPIAQSEMDALCAWVTRRPEAQAAIIAAEEGRMILKADRRDLEMIKTALNFYIDDYEGTLSGAADIPIAREILERIERILES